MTSHAQSAIPAFVVAGVSLVLAMATGVAWLGTPLRLVQLLTIVGLGMTAGVSWSQAVSRVQQQRPESRDTPAD